MKGKVIAMDDKRVLFSVGDGPESIEIYTSENRAVVDWAADYPALYIDVTLRDVQVHLGPFTLRSIREAVEKALVRREENPS